MGRRFIKYNIVIVKPFKFTLKNLTICALKCLIDDSTT